MKTFIATFALLFGTLAASAHAQYIVGTPVTTYYAPAAPVVAPAPVVAAPVAAPVVAAPIVYRRPITTYYAPAPVVTSYYTPAPVVTSYYAPTVAAPVAAPVVAAPVATPYVVGRPVVLGRSAWGTRQVYMPGQPILNTLRAVTP